MKKIGTKILETENLILRKIELEDYKAAYKNWCSDPLVAKHVTWDAHENDNVTKEIFEMWVKEYEKPGCTSYLPDSLGGLVRMMNVPVAVMRIHGNFVTSPQWNHKNKGIRVEADLFPIVKPDEIKAVSADEVMSRIREAFAYDDYRWQLDNNVVIDHPDRANGLHCLLYKCPACGEEHRMNSGGCELWCEACGKRWRQNEYGQLEALSGETEFPHIPDWSSWERECVRREIEDGTYYFEDDVQVQTLPNWTKFYKHGMGKLIQTPEGTRIECKAYGEDTVVVKAPLDMYSMHVEYDYLGRGDCVDISTNDESYWLYLTKRDAITKLSFATEEIYKKAYANANFAKRTK